jgi:acyl carrier protein
MNIDPRLKTAILKALHLDDWDLTAETLAFEVPGWDSLSHVNVLMEAEKEFGIRFGASEVMRLDNVGDLDRLVARKLQQKGA